MIKGQTIEFGYGDVAVSSRRNGKISFQSFKPATVVGANVPDDVIYYDDEIILNISYEGYKEIMELLCEVKDENIRSFRFSNYVFDFSKYNIESINTCIKHLKNAISGYLFCLAC